MNPTLIYLIKVNIGMALFYMFYRLFFANDTFWKTRRLYLIFSILISFIYPVFSIVDWLQNQQPIQNLVTGYVQLQEFTITANVSKTIFTLENTLLAIYILVTTVLFVRLLTQLFAILNIYLKYKKASINQQEIIVVNKDITPFSFFGNIYLNPNLHSKEELNQILIHELTHVRQWHSMDVLVSEMACIAFWFNPAVWLLKKEIRQNLEYLADDKVIKSGFDSKSYQYHLIQLSYQTSDYRLTNNFNVLPLKKRIIMMNQQKSRKSSALKYLLIAPITFSLVLLSSAETLAAKGKSLLENNELGAIKAESEIKNVNELIVVENVQTKNKATDSPQDIVSPTIPTGPDKAGVFMVVETMPKYPGGDSEMFKYLGNNIKYPVEAQNKGIQGRVICQFVVNKDGSISDVKVVRGIDPNLDKEAIRVVEAMPNWTAGMQKGKKVRVKFTLPINFKLQNNEEKDKLKEPNFSDIKDIPQDSRPLVIVNDTIVTTEQLSKYKPEEIESINVIKGEAANKLYGEKGKNGAISIKLK